MGRARGRRGRAPARDGKAPAGDRLTRRSSRGPRMSPASIVCRPAGLLRSRSGISPMATSTDHAGNTPLRKWRPEDDGPRQAGEVERRCGSRRPGPEIGSPYRPCADPSDSFARDRGISPTGGKHESHREHTVFGCRGPLRVPRVSASSRPPSNRRPRLDSFASAVPRRGPGPATRANASMHKRLEPSDGRAPRRPQGCDEGPFPPLRGRSWGRSRGRCPTSMDETAVAARARFMRPVVPLAGARLQSVRGRARPAPPGSSASAASTAGSASSSA